MKPHHGQSIALARLLEHTQLGCILLKSQMNELFTQDDTGLTLRAGGHSDFLTHPRALPPPRRVTHTGDHPFGVSRRGLQTQRHSLPGAAAVRGGGHGSVEPAVPPWSTLMPNITTKPWLPHWGEG